MKKVFIYFNLCVLFSAMMVSASEVQLRPVRVAVDMNTDYHVDFEDLAALAAYWLDDGCGYPGWCDYADIDTSGTVNFADFASMSEHWNDALDRPYEFNETIKIFSPTTDGLSHILLPDGEWFHLISPTGGIQEAIDYAVNNNIKKVQFFGRKVVGLGDAIYIPPAKDFYIDLRGPTLNWANGSPDKDMIVIDSAVNCRYLFGTLVYSGYASLLKLKPQSSVDSFIGISGTEIWESTLSKNGHKTGDGINLDVTYGSITGNRFNLIQIGGFDRNVVCEDGPGAISNNTFYIGHSQGAGTYHLLDECANSRNNRWNFSCDGEWSSGVKGIKTRSVNNIYFLTVLNIPDTSEGLILDTNASGNIFIERSLCGYTIMPDAGSQNRLLTGPKRSTSAISVSASPFMYVNQSLECEIVTIRGGMVSKIQMSADGVTYYNAGTTSGNFDLLPGMGLEITYSDAPNIRKYR